MALKLLMPVEETTFKNVGKRKENNMDWLKEVLGDELYSKFVEKINAFNGDEKNKDHQIKIANLSSGEYVGKGKYDALETEHNSKLAELTAANKTIDDFKKASKGNEDLQGKITSYEKQVADLQAELKASKIESAIKLGLLEAKTSDVDYMMFKLKEKGELELDENGRIKGLDDKIASLKTQYPNHFESNKEKKIDPNKLPDGASGGKVEPETLADAIKQSYESKN